MSYYYGSIVRAACTTCGYAGTPYALELHSCDIQESGGRCLDYPCCGHTDGDGCQTLPEHTSEYWSEVMTSGNSRFAFEPGSPEWYDAAEEDERYNGYDEDAWYDSREECESAGMHGDSGTGTADPAVFTCTYCGEPYAVDPADWV